MWTFNTIRKSVLTHKNPDLATPDNPEGDVWSDLWMIQAQSSNGNRALLTSFKTFDEDEAGAFILTLSPDSPENSGDWVALAPVAGSPADQEAQDRRHRYQTNF